MDSSAIDLFIPLHSPFKAQKFWTQNEDTLIFLTVAALSTS